MCVSEQNTGCDDQVPPVLYDATATIVLEAAVDTFGLHDDPVTADDDISSDADRTARQNLTCRIGRTSDRGFIRPPPPACSNAVTCGCAFIEGADMTIVGDHTITYTVVDDAAPDANAATATRRVQVRDTIPPTITLNTPERVERAVDEDSQFAVLQQQHISRATANDLLDDLNGVSHTSQITATGVDQLLQALGVARGGSAWGHAQMDHQTRLRAQGWPVVYGGFADANGNPVVPVTQTFTVVDRTAPALTLDSADYSVEAQRGSNAAFGTVDRGATAIDYVYGDLTSAVVVTSDGGFNIGRVGVYAVTYEVADPSGNSIEEVGTVRVVDTTNPVIMLVGGSNINVQYGAPWADPLFSADDNLDPPSALGVQVASNQTGAGRNSTLNFAPLSPSDPATAAPVNMTAALGSTFVLNYTVTDANGNAAELRQRTVTVIDTSPPTFPGLDGNDTFITVVSGDYHADDCPGAVDNFDGPIAPTSGVCREYNATKLGATERLPGVVYREVFEYRNETRFAQTGSFNVTYFVIDSNNNTGTGTRMFSVVDALSASAPDDGLGAGGIVGILILVILLLALVPIAKVYRDRNASRKSATETPTPLTMFVSPAYNGGDVWPPSPEDWFHGDIDRTIAEDRLRGVSDQTGVFLVRTRNSTSSSASYALSLVVDERFIHYAISIPEDGHAPLLIQNTPTPPEWGTCLHDIIETLGTAQPGCVVPVGLTTPVPVPSNAADLASLYHPSRGTAAAPLEVYRTVTGSPTQYDLSSAFKLSSSGMYYRIFVPPDRVPASVLMYTLVSGGFQPITRPEVTKTTKVYVRVDPEQLPALVGAEQGFATFEAPAHAGGAQSSGQLIYDSHAPSQAPQTYENTGQMAASSMYASVKKGKKNASQSNPQFAVPLDSGGVHHVRHQAYSQPLASSGGHHVQRDTYNQPLANDDVGQQTHKLGLDGFDEPGGGDVLYSSVEHGGGGGGGVQPTGSGDILYSAVSHGKVASHPADMPVEAGGGVIYSAVTIGAAPQQAESAVTSDVLYSSVQHSNDKPAAKPAVDKNTAWGGRAGTDGLSGRPKKPHQKSVTLKSAARAAPAAKTAPQDPLWVHQVDRTEAESILLSEGGTDGLYLVRPKGAAHAMSIILRGRFIHRLIEAHPGGKYVVDRQPGNWGSNLSEVVQTLELEMKEKHGLAITRAILRSAQEEDFEGFC